jgi:DNA-binding response OmpR family regulator
MPAMLIADDNQQITKILAEFARHEGFQTETACDGEETLRKFRTGSFDILLLDVMMPKKDGFAVCREIRAISNVPILMITARGEDFERIMGLDIGADDYIVKPFSTGEVMARVRAVLRRLDRTPEETASGKTLQCGTLAVNIKDCRVTISDKKISVTKKELDLLWLLMENKGKVFSRDHLLNSLWGYDYFGDNRTIDSHIKRLRAKLDTVPHEGWQIRTVWGVGYTFEEAAP